MLTLHIRNPAVATATLLAGAAIAFADPVAAAPGTRAVGEAYMTQGAGFAHDVRIPPPQPFRLIAPPPPVPVFDARHTGEAYATAGDREMKTVEEPRPSAAYAFRRDDTEAG